MSKRTWKAAVVAAMLLMAASAFAALAADTATKTKSTAKTTGQETPGCVMMKGEAAKDGCKPGCILHGEVAKAGCKPGCAMHGKMGKSCCKAGDMKGCAMHGEMGKSCCKAGDAKGCAKHGMKGCATHGQMKGCGSGHMAAGMPGCGMKGGMGPGMGCGPMGGPGMHAGMGAGCGPEMLKALDLTPAQEKKVQAIHEKQARATVQAHADLRLAEMDLQSLKQADSPDKAKIDAQIDRIAQLRAGIEKSRMATMLEVRSLLTPEQLKKCQVGPKGCAR